jgi:hypothetical protein
MSFTKSASTYLQKEAAPKGILAALLSKIDFNKFRLKDTAKFLGKIPTTAYKATKPAVEAIGKGLTKGVTATGRAAVKHPGYVLPAAALGIYGAYNFKPNFKKYWLHTDPKQNLTYQAPLLEGNRNSLVVRPGSIKYRDPALKEYYNTSRLSDHILY